MKIFAIFPDDYKNSMSIHPMIKPSEKLTELNVTCLEQKDFFSSYVNDVKENDVCIVWIGIKDEERIQKFSNLKCKKHLRNVDSCSSDRVLFRKELELSKKIKFDSFLITYCTEYNLNFLADKGIRSIKYPHLMDFSTLLSNKEKQFDVLMSGQMSEKSYPLRTRLAKLFSSQNIFKFGLLHHPGHKLNEIRHDYYGDKYVEVLSQSKISIVCTGDDDSLVMKYLEFAKAGTLPIGDAPTNIPEDAKNAMILINHSMLDSEIFGYAKNVLSNEKELEYRVSQYQNSIKQHFDISKTAEILQKIIKEDYDR